MGGRRSVPLAKPRVTRLPTQDDKAIRDFRQATTQQTLGRGGRQSTILSDMLRSLTGSVGYLGR